MTIGRRLGSNLERIIYAIAGLPIAIHGAATAPTPEAQAIRRAQTRV